MPCNYPEHHGSAKGGGLLLFLAAAAGVAIVVGWVHHHAAAIESFVLIAFVVLAAIAAAGLAVLLLVLRPGRAGRLLRGCAAHVFLAVLVRATWHRTTRNLGLAYPDRHRGDKIRAGGGKPKIRRLRARVRPTVHGVDVRMRTIAGTGRLELDDVAQHLADAWRCARVQVVQERPGRLLVRGLRADPLLQPYGAHDAPQGTFTRPDLTRLYLGRDGFGNHRWLPLGRNVTGITVAGLPGTGKTSLTSSWLCQTAGTAAVQYAAADGKGGSDYLAWKDRCWLYCEDDLASALALFEDLHAEMRRRLANWPAELGCRNAWEHGPDEGHPLIIWPVDECQTYLDVTQFKGDSAREAMARRCAALAAQVIRKSGSVMMLGILSTQKPTGDSLPTSCRDNCALSVSFGLRTNEAAVAALGESIRQYDTYSPLTLRESVGVCSATVATGADPFTLLRVPEVTEAMSAGCAAATERYRREPWADAPPERLPEPVTNGWPR